MNQGTAVQIGEGSIPLQRVRYDPVESSKQHLLRRLGDLRARNGGKIPWDDEGKVSVPVGCYSGPCGCVRQPRVHQYAVDAIMYEAPLAPLLVWQNDGRVDHPHPSQGLAHLHVACGKEKVLWLDLTTLGP